MLAAVAGLAVVLAYLVLWYEVSPRLIGRSDFTNTYVGATLVREGDASSMFDPALQAPLHAQLIAPDREGNLPYDAAPLAAVVAAPLTLLGLDTAYRIWSLLQFLMIAVAAAVAVRAAPAEVPLRRDQGLAVGLLALACLGTGSTLLLGQWDGVSAVGLAASYACLRRGRMGTAGAILAVTSLLAKPHLAMGLAAFVLGWRERRLVMGMLAGGLATVAASLLAVGPGGVAGFVGSLGSQVNAWPLARMVSLVGITGSLFGQTLAAHLVAAAGSVAAIIAAGLLGAAVRKRPFRLEAALAGATVLSLLASPHTGWDDLALLVPAAAWSLTALVARRAGSGWLTTAATAVWVAISLAAYLDLATGAAVPLGVLTPWALIAAAALAVAVCRRQRAGEVRPASPRRLGDVRAMSVGGG
jgi:hypothetical protein